MNPIKPATPRAIDNPTGNTRARHDAMPNRAHPNANSTTVTSHALTRELPVRSALNVSGVTPAIHGMAKPSNHMSPAKATVPVTAMQKATAPNTPASWASRQYNATKAINSSGKVMAYAALNSRNAGSSVIVTRLLRSMTTADVGNSEQATGNHSDRAGMGTERRLGHENLP